MLWDLKEGKRLYSLDAGDIIHSLVFSPNRYWLCAATTAGIKVRWRGSVFLGRGLAVWLSVVYFWAVIVVVVGFDMCLHMFLLGVLRTRGVSVFPTFLVFETN